MSDIAAAAGKLLGCLVDKQKDFQVSNDDDKLKYGRCACFFNFMEVGQECNVSTDDFKSQYSYALSDDQIDECRKYWAAWNLRTREVSFWPRAEWWESWPGVLAQCVMVVLVLILLMWLCEDVIRGFINRAEGTVEAARSLIMVESPSKPQHEEPKAEQHAQPYVAYSPMDNTDTDSESEEEIELEAPQTQKQKLRNFHNFQVHDDHSSSQTDFHPLMATHIPLTASVDEHRTSIFPPGATPP